MTTTETPVKESKLLQYLVQTGHDTDAFRMAVLQCVCECHNILDPEKYLNNEAVIRYVYQPWEGVDWVETELYSRHEHEPVEDYVASMHGEVVTPRLPRTIVYDRAYELITPVSVIEDYIHKHYSVLSDTYFILRTKY